MADKLLIEPHYLGNISYYVAIRHHAKIIWEVSEHFVKQTFRNRTVILSANGPLNLIVPVKFGNRTPFKDVRIDYSQRWFKEHWRAVHSAYAKSPYFEFFGWEYHDIWHKSPKMLLDLCINLVTICLENLQIVRQIEFTEGYHKSYESPFSDYRNRIHPKKTSFNEFVDPSKDYFQNFGKEFVPNLSVLDLLFSMGPEASAYLKEVSLLNNEQI